jgi:hypothetical protein
MPYPRPCFLQDANSHIHCYKNFNITWNLIMLQSAEMWR